MRRFANWYLRMRGWSFDGEVDHRSFIAIGVPHTSNWDFVVFLAVIHHLGVRAKAIGKESLVRWPYGGLMRRLGIVPVHRDRDDGVVGQVVEAFANDPDLVIVIAPEGTRGVAAHWKSGFYHMAQGAGVPVVVAGVDGPRKWAGVLGELVPTGDIGADMDHIRALVAGVEGIRPGNATPARLREEG